MPNIKKKIQQMKVQMSTYERYDFNTQTVKKKHQIQIRNTFREYKPDETLRLAS